ncbi:MAG: DNA translocase FtsK [Ruminococcaceae bacterium]|nr:DNA translocase FtsK [Oscillospiraceae bacterium]
MARKKNDTNTKNTKASSSKKGKAEDKIIASAPKKNSATTRIVTACGFVVVGILSVLGYFDNEGLFIRLLCGLFKGLFGWGFYLIPPMLVAAGLVMLFGWKKNMKLKVTAILLLPVIMGGLYQLLFAKPAYSLSWAAFKYLWMDGINCISGGVFSGMITLLLKVLLSGIGAGIILFALFFGALFVCLYPWIAKLVAKHKERMANMPKEEPEEIIEEPKPKRERAKVSRPENKSASEKVRSRIDIDIDEPVDVVGKSAKSDIKVEGVFDKDVPFEEPVNPPPPKKRERLDREELIQEFTAGMEIQDGPVSYQFPPIEMLSTDNGKTKLEPKGDILANQERLENTLASFGVRVNINNIVRGPAVTRFEMELEAGVKLNKLTNLADDIALSLGVAGVRIAAIPNKISTVGIEVPNRNISTVYLRDIIDTPEFRNSPSKLSFAIGKNIGGEAIVGNIAKLPHLLVAGTTGSGKSVCLNSLILSILYKATPDEVKFIMIDPKMVEFKIYNGIPHLLVPVVTEAKKSAGALQWAVTEMMKRYSIFADTGARDLQSYNKMIADSVDIKPMPQIVVVIDELADLMLVAAKEVEESICRVAQMGRAAGVHLVIATQSPRADVITGLMKANIPSRIAFKVASSLESRIILDAGGSADKLMGNGDLLYAPIGASKPMRIQGTWVTDEERENILNFIKEGSKPEYSTEVIEHIEKAAEAKKNGNAPVEQEETAFDDCDELYGQAVEAILESGQASVSYLQRRLKVGYARAARLVDQMEDKGVVGPFEGSKPRQILIDRQQWQEMQFIHKTAPVVEYSRKDTEVEQQTSVFEE